MSALRAAPHVHSEWSYDAEWPLADLARLFGRLGYDAVLMAEHDRGFDQARWDEYREECARASGGRVLLVPGMEYSDAGNTVHTLVWGDAPFLGEGVPPEELVARAADEGVTAVFAHPRRRRAAEILPPEAHAHLAGVEWWNRKYDGYAPGPDTGRMLARNHGVLPFVGMDFHSPRQLLPLAMVLGVHGDPTPAGVFDALKAGRCRPQAFGASALRFTGGRGLRVAQAAERTRRALARHLRG